MDESPPAPTTELEAVVLVLRLQISTALSCKLSTALLMCFKWKDWRELSLMAAPVLLCRLESINDDDDDEVDDVNELFIIIL